MRAPPSAADRCRRRADRRYRARRRLDAGHA